MDGAGQWEAGVSVAASSTHVQHPTIMVCHRYEKKKTSTSCIVFPYFSFLLSSGWNMPFFSKSGIFKDDKSFVAVFIRRRSKKKECSSSFLNENQA